MPYFTQVRMRARCAGGIEGVDTGSGLAGALISSTRVGGGDVTRRMRGLRADWSAVVSGTAGVLTGRFPVKSASAAWRALVVRSRSSPRGYVWTCRLSKDDAPND